MTYGPKSAGLFMEKLGTFLKNGKRLTVDLLEIKSENIQEGYLELVKSI